MLQLIKIKIILLSLCTILSVSLFAQREKTTEESTIVMTQAELNSFLSTIADARRSQLNERENKKLKEHLLELRLKYNESSELKTRSSGYGDLSNQQILRELRYLNQRMDNLSGSNSNMLPSLNRDNSTIIMPGGNTNPYPYYQGNVRSATVIPNNESTDNDVNDDRINELQAKIDSLRNVGTMIPIVEKDNSFADSLNADKLKLNDLRRQMDSLEMKMKNVDNPVKSEASNENKAYFKQQVYFDNNSELLRANYFPHIQDVTQILVKYPEAKILLEGWASPLGNTTYNKQLSMRRAESVERAFINNGIDTSRIITSFRGEDKSSSEQHARRVDMSIVLR